MQRSTVIGMAVVVAFSVAGCSSGGGSAPPADAASSQASVPATSAEEPSEAEVAAVLDTFLCSRMERADKTVRFLTESDFEGHKFYKVKPMAEGSVFTLEQSQESFAEMNDPIAEPLAVLIADFETVAQSAEDALDGKDVAPWPDLEASLAAVYEVRDPCATEMPT